MIGRKEEQLVLERAWNSDKPELVALVGRRRVGKTFLVRQYFKDKIDFELIGLKDGNKESQLMNFTFSLKRASGSEEFPRQAKNWMEAFNQLIDYLELLERSEKRLIFFDELPWLASHRSGFMTGFSYFWNSYASKKNILVIICGSAAAWMIKRVVNDRGGLHNRVTRTIVLQPFTLAETRSYFLSRDIQLDHYQILLIYMVMGGIPHYLDQVEKGRSAVQNIDQICFQRNGFLRNEFNNLYQALFSQAERYEAVIKALSKTWKGMTRSEILSQIDLKDGGGVTAILKALELSGFITAYYPHNKKKKSMLYRLTDHYSLFYLQFIADAPTHEQGYWHVLSQSQAWRSWSGYAFENICFQHVDKLKQALGISGIHSRSFSFVARASDEMDGAQIDLLIDRNDRTINLCEVKFYDDQVIVSKSMAANIRNKRSVFKAVSKTKKHIFISLISPYGVRPNKHSLGLVDNDITMDDLF